MNELYQRWTTYRDRVVPKDAPSVQKTESRRAYYAGCQAVLELIDHLDDSNPLERLRALRSFRAEVEQFRQEVAAGRA